MGSSRSVQRSYYSPPRQLFKHSPVVSWWLNFVVKISICGVEYGCISVIWSVESLEETSVLSPSWDSGYIGTICVSLDETEASPKCHLCPSLSPLRWRVMPHHTWLLLPWCRQFTFYRHKILSELLTYSFQNDDI